jgi:hypothetical protein
MDDTNKCNYLSDKNVKKKCNVENSTKENSKYSKKNKSIYTSKDLKDFISNLNKFNLNSAFDHKGAKSFLHSKKKALKEIILDESILSGEEDSEKKKKQIKDFKINSKSCKGFTNKIRGNTQISPRKKKVVPDIKKCTQSPKKRYKARPNKRERSCNNLLSVIDNNELKINKKTTNFCSEIELKMYQDKDLNKIHPIKTFNGNQNEKCKNCNNLADSLHTKIKEKKSNSTLIDLVNEIS